VTGPRVSVVVPCYNLGHYLGDAVDSVLAQTFTDVEILVVDDGSTDAPTRAVLDGFTRPRTRVLRTENRGLPGAKNLGLAQTTGELLCMLDADDLLEPEMLARSVAALDADASVSFASHWLRTFGDEQWEWTPESCDFPALLDMNTVNGSALVRRGALEAVGGFDESFLDGCEDWDLWITMVERGYRGVILPEFLFRYRRRAGSMSQVMMEGDTHPRLYRRLVAKHAASYRAHLAPLLVRREREEAHLKGQIHDLELDDYLVVTPGLSSARDDLRDIERWRAAEDKALQNATLVAAAHEVHAERDAVLATAEHLGSELAAVRRTHEEAVWRYLGAEAAVNRVMDELRALRKSWSWRLTRPLRAALDLLRPSKGGR
jgi:glycosyltransferase involved in cell wall biosynthesis